MEMKYIIHMTDRRAVCPVCKGIALLQEELDCLWCMDCRGVFKIKEIGRTDKQVICIKSA